MPCERKHVEAILAWMDGLIHAAQAEIEKHPGNDKSSAEALFYWADGPEQRAAREALAACDESPWRSMESAPKDGTAVLLHNNLAPGNPSGRMESCEGYNTVVGEWWASDESDRDADGFGDWMCYMDAIEDPRCPFEPTHWMPLPAAPEGV